MSSEKISLYAADGYRLTATRYHSSGAQAHIIVGGATGVPQGFYRRFAEYAAARGFSIMTLDYRGIGLSAPASLKGFRMNYMDWARLDLAAAVQAMSQNSLPLFMIGHSFGGQGFGFLPNHDKVSGLYTFGTSAGWNGWMPTRERLRVQFMWDVLGPAIVSWKGYLAWSKLGMGEDLPLDVYRQWKKWCSYPNYFFGDPDMQDEVRCFENIRCPILAANSLDDLWALPASRDSLMAGYIHAPLETLDLDPKSLGMHSIGHMGYFGRNASVLWDAALLWIKDKMPEAGK